MARKRVSVLQVGRENRFPSGEVDGLNWFFYPLYGSREAQNEVLFDPEKKDQVRHFDVLCLTEFDEQINLGIFDDVVDDYRWFAPECLAEAAWSSEQRSVLYSKQLRFFAPEEWERWLQRWKFAYFTVPYGDRQSPVELQVSPSFSGKRSYDGLASVRLEGDFGDRWQELCTWRHGSYKDPGQAVDFFLEYEKEGSIALQLRAEVFKRKEEEAAERYYFEEKQMQKSISLGVFAEQGIVYFSLLACGKGTVQIKALHRRHSRLGDGAFLPGGKILRTSNRQELAYYYSRGNLKPPLNVYFSGWRTQEGFEGYYMLKRMKHPFLLVTDPRLEGGAFYLGSPEYEAMVCHAIQMALKDLHFSEKELILSGLSMGTTGASYYGSILHPHAILLGKPLMKLGNIAEDFRLHHPGILPSGLDETRLYSEAKNPWQEINAHVMDRIRSYDFSQTKVAIAYMKNDDLDREGYQVLADWIHQNGGYLISKGYVGRHNDQHTLIVNWFLRQLQRIVREDFHG